MGFTVAIAQINSTADVERNLATVREYSERAAEQGADLLVFPEATMAAFGADLAKAAREHGESWKTELTWLAAELEITIAVGEFVVEDDRRVKNLLVVYTPQGERYEYAKIHLYDALGYAESKTVVAGKEPLVVNVDGVGVGLALCYDVRFPKLFAELARAGAQVTIVSASWASGPGKLEQWQVLTRARALDSTAFVVAVDQADPQVTGVEVPEKGPHGVGHSVAADPFGHVVAELGSDQELRLVELNIDAVAEAQKNLPILENARLGY